MVLTKEWERKLDRKPFKLFLLILPSFNQYCCYQMDARCQNVNHGSYYGDPTDTVKPKEPWMGSNEEKFPILLDEFINYAYKLLPI